MNSSEEQKAIDALSVYCRVMEVHIQSIAQGTAPLVSGPGAKEWALAVAQAGLGAQREVEFLRFLREKNPHSPEER